MIFLFFLLSFSDKIFGTLGAGGPISTIQANMDVKKLHLSLKIDPETKRISGFAEWTIYLKQRPPNQIAWDLFAGLIVSAVEADGNSLNFHQKEHKLFIDLPANDKREWQIRIIYEGQPLPAIAPPWRGGFTWTTTDNGDPWVAVSCQGEGAKVWFPSKDHMGDKIEGIQLDFTVPKGLYCAANGVLIDRTSNEDGWETFHWESKYPISPYNISFGLAKYSLEKDLFKGPGGRETPIIFYYLQNHQKADQLADDKRDFATKRKDLVSEFKKYLDFYARHYGPFPFADDKAGIVQTPYLGMEHQTLNAYGNHFKMENGYDWLLLHELGHEWWGNKVSLADWRDLWIHEGICTYTTAVFLEEDQGLDAAQKFLAGLNNQLSNQKPIVGSKNASTTESYSLDTYYKGALILHSLRFLIGKATLDKLLREFANSPAGTYLHPVNTSDFIALAETISKKKLDWFFDRYFYHAALPSLTAVRKGRRLQLAWDSEHFAMPIEVRVISKGKVRYHRIDMSGGSGKLKIPKSSQYAIDPNNWVLKAKP